ncbi:MAG: sugar ABC transporter permease [Clostridiales bacterium]|jgi:multiple sugar transport system permease protein|nr:sugar ABC transporter permease [Clostridiales bacterium]
MPVKRVKKSNWRQSEVLWGYIFILPVILGLLLFYFGPMLFSLLISFMNWDMITPMTFAGLDNYSRMISDPLVVDSVKATALYTLLTVPSAVTASFLTAMLLNSKAKGRAFFRIVFYIPSIVPAVVSAALWIYLFDPMFGPINLLSKAIGIGQIGFIYT